jgi:transposase
MREVAEQMEELRARQRELLATGADRDLEIAAMAKALGISRQTAYSWLRVPESAGAADRDSTRP